MRNLWDTIDHLSMVFFSPGFWLIQPIQLGAGPMWFGLILQRKVALLRKVGYAFLDKRLYVLEEWFTADYGDRWKVCGIPETLSFRTEPELGLDMITALVERGVLPFRWVTCDARYGENASSEAIRPLVAQELR